MADRDNGWGGYGGNVEARKDGVMVIGELERTDLAGLDDVAIGAFQASLRGSLVTPADAD